MGVPVQLQGRDSQRIQVGGFATRIDAQGALDKALDRLRPGGRAATLTLAEFAEALEALRRLPANPKTPIVFPNARGGHVDLHNFRQRHWRPALVKAGGRAAPAAL